VVTIDEVKKLFGSSNNVTDKLNYYRKWVGIILIGISFL
jgi:hypothetical protein